MHHTGVDIHDIALHYKKIIGLEHFKEYSLESMNLTSCPTPQETNDSDSEFQALKLLGLIIMNKYVYSKIIE